jgi:hypothetical protein
MKRADNSAEPNARTLADVSALADGTLDPGRAAAVRERIAQSPELSELYEHERRAVSALHAARADRAPARLRARVQAQRQPARQRRGRLVYGGAFAAAAAAIVAALVLLLPGGAPGAPSVSQAAGLALRGPALAAPAPDQAHPRAAKLRQDVQEVYFPDWSRWFGWRAAGQRIDHLGGRLAKTVYYEHNGEQIAYTILAAPALRWPGAQTRMINGTELQSFGSDGRVIVTWRRAGHTCVLSGKGISAGQLAALAAWKAPGLDG